MNSHRICLPDLFGRIPANSPIAFGTALLLMSIMGCTAETFSDVRALSPPLGDTAQAVAFSPDGSFVAAVSNPVADAPSRGKLIVWDVASGKEFGQRSFPVGLSAVLFTSDQRLAVGWIDGTIEYLDTIHLKSIAQHKSNHGAVTSLALAVDQKRLLVGHTGGVIEILDSTDLKLSAGASKAEHVSPIVGLAPLAGTSQYLCLYWDGVWKIRSFEAHSAEGLGEGELGGVCHGLAIDREDKLFVTAGPEKTARIIELATGKEVGVVSEELSDVMAVGFLGNSERIVTAGRGGMVRIWNWRQNLQIQESRLHAGIKSLAVNGHQSTWVAGDETGVVHIGRLSKP